MGTFHSNSYFPTNIHLSRPIPKENVRIEDIGISGIRIQMPNEAKILIFTDNDLTHITDDHFEIKLVA